MRHKAGLLNYLLENKLFQVIRAPQTRPSPAPTRVSSSCFAFIQRITSNYLGSPCLVEAYRLRQSSSGFRRTANSPTGVVFVCSVISPVVREGDTVTASTSAINFSGWPALQRQLLVSVINKIRKDIEDSNRTVARANWKQCTTLLRWERNVCGLQIPSPHISVELNLLK